MVVSLLCGKNKATCFCVSRLTQLKGGSGTKHGNKKAVVCVVLIIQDLFNKETFCGLYHGKSPLNHHFGEDFWNFFQASNKQTPPQRKGEFLSQPSMALRGNFFVSFPDAYHPWDWYIYLLIWLFSCFQRNKIWPNVGKHTSPIDGKEECSWSNFHGCSTYPLTYPPSEIRA